MRRGFQLCLRAQHSIWAVERVSVLQGGGTGSNPVLLRTSVLFCTFLFGPKIEVFILHANAQNQVRRYDQSEVDVCRGGIHDGTWPGARPLPGNPTQKTQLRLAKTCVNGLFMLNTFLLFEVGVGGGFVGHWSGHFVGGGGGGSSFTSWPSTVASALFPLIVQRMQRAIEQHTLQHL